MKEKFTKQLPQKTAEDYEMIAEEFSVTRSLIWPELEEFVKYIKDGNRILDLDCGNGRLYELFENLSMPLNSRDKCLADSIDYVGVDRSSNLIKLAKERWKKTKAKFLISNILDLSDFKKNSFDAVFLIAVLHHIPSYSFRLKI